MRILSQGILIWASTRILAAPTGGALKRGRGCIKFTPALATCFSLLAAPFVAASGDSIAVPSGMDVVFHEMVQDRSAYGLSYHFRFVAPQIGGELNFEKVATDMEELCNAYALPRVAITGPRPSQIVITLMNTPTDFGTPDPETTQYFEAYSVENGACIWEVF